MLLVYLDDNHRVQLTPLPGHSDCTTDYINACYVDVSPHYFYATYSLSFSSTYRDTLHPASFWPLRVSRLLHLTNTRDFANFYVQFVTILCLSRSLSPFLNLPHKFCYTLVPKLQFLLHERNVASTVYYIS